MGTLRFDFKIFVYFILINGTDACRSDDVSQAKKFNVNKSS